MAYIQGLGLTKYKPGDRFGRLTLDQGPFYKQKNIPWWSCLCDCGNHKDALLSNIVSGNTSSCGCIFREHLEAHNKAKITHGNCVDGKLTTEYRTWASMRRRCLGQTAADYDRYGGRGIGICPQWDSFEVFLRDMGPKPRDGKKYTIDRIDVNGNYEPGNCRWATSKEQGRNKRNSKIFEFNGERMLACEWAEKLGVKAPLITDRIKRGWSIAEALTVLPGGKRA